MMIPELEDIISASKKTEPALPGYPLLNITGEDVTSNPYLVKGVIGEGEIAFMFGDSGTLKSFVATDMAFHVAIGSDWRGHRVRKSGVMLVIGEGQSGYKKRLKAITQHYGFGDAPIWVVPEAISLLDDSAALAVWLKQAEQELGTPIGLILMDTFSLMLGGGDESSNADVSLALNSLRTAVAGRAVLLIHHTGHGDKGRERGAYQIRGNADTRIRVERNRDTVTLKCLKRKDDDSFQPIHLTYKVIELGHDVDGEVVTSLVMVDAAQADVDAILKAASHKPTRAEKAIVLAIKSVTARLGYCHEDALRDAAYQSPDLSKSDGQEAKKKAFARAVGSLINTQRITRNEDNCYLLLDEDEL